MAWKTIRWQQYDIDHLRSALYSLVCLLSSTPCGSLLMCFRLFEIRVPSFWSNCASLTISDYSNFDLCSSFYSYLSENVLLMVLLVVMPFVLVRMHMVSLILPWRRRRCHGIADTQRESRRHEGGGRILAPHPGDLASGKTRRHYMPIPPHAASAVAIAC